MHSRKKTESVKGGCLNSSFRNLRKTDLGGVIFGCTHHTISECLYKQLFGLPGQHFSYVRNIEPGLPLFLFSYTDRMLHGVYEAASQGQMNIDPYGWTQDGAERTQYPAQVRICSKMYCQPLPEKVFGSIIKDNYYKNKLFYFELDHAQVKCLLSLFVPTPNIGQSVAAVPGSKRDTSGPVSMDKDRDGFPKDLKSCDNLVHDPSARRRNTPFDMLCPSSPLDDVDDEDACRTTRNTPDADFVDAEVKELFLPRSELWSEPGKISVSDSSNGKGEDDNMSEFLQFQQVEGIDKDQVLEKLKKLAFQHSSVISTQTCLEALPGSCVHDSSVKKNDLNSTEELMQTLKAVTERMVDLENKQATAERELDQLRKDSDQLRKDSDQLRIDSDSNIYILQERVSQLEVKLGVSLSAVNDSWNESATNQFLGSENSIYLIGGYDGISWLNSLDCYSPSLDYLAHLQPMSLVRSYAAAAALDGCLYVFGGGDGVKWYDTVESYNPSCDQWTPKPSLLREKGSLAGATLNGKVYAIGGGNGIETFSDVEMLDPLLGRWINCQPMLQKRFAPAASEYNGALYIVGGYNGQSYLNSAERYDPREASWNPLPSMKSRRGCHSLAVFHDKLYALGGYDGQNMVSTVEIFDPRSNSWLTCDSMNRIRGYAGSAVLADTLFVIGGVENGTSVVDKVECYQEGIGWVTTSLNAVGRRCFFSAITL